MADAQRVSMDVASQDTDDITTVGDFKEDAPTPAAAMPARPLAYTSIAYTQDGDGR